MIAFWLAAATRSALSWRVRSAFFCCVSSAASRSSSTVCVPVRRSAFFSLLLSWLARLIFFLRSEEHTYELQSLMRISYAVFCLKKQTHYNVDHLAQGEC